MLVAQQPAPAGEGRLLERSGSGQVALRTQRPGGLSLRPFFPARPHETALSQMGCRRLIVFR